MSVASTSTIHAVTGGVIKGAVALKVAEKLPEAEIVCKEILSTHRTRSEVLGSETTDGGTFRTVLDVESERYDEIEALGAGNKHYVVLQRAEALMAVAFALPYLNMRPTEEGGLSRAIGLVEGQRDIMHHGELGQYHAGIYKEAVDLLNKLLRFGEADEKVCYVL